MTVYAVAESVPEQLSTFPVERVEVGRLTLCGSTRFRAEYELWNKRLTLGGFLVYSVSGFGHSGDTFTPEEKQRLDQIHLAKIDAAHAIVVINPEGYIGESTQREIEHAQRTGKRVYYTHVGMPTVYQLRTGPDGGGSLRYRAFGYEPTPSQTVSQDRAVEASLAGELASAAADVLGYRVGDLPDKGWLHDNDPCRAALSRLSNSLPAFKKSALTPGSREE